MNGPSDGFPRVLIAPAAALIALAAFSYGFVPIRASNDVWWHLKTGKVIVEAGRLPATDVFTYTGEDVPWHNHEWLAQVLFYEIFQWGGGGEDETLIGLRAVIGFKSVVLAATFLLVLLMVRQRCGCWAIAALIALLALDVSRRTLYPRPPVLTYLFLALFLLVLSNWKARRWPRPVLFVLPPLMVLWANLHGGFLVGLIVLFFYGLGEVAEYFFWGDKSSAAPRRRLPQEGDRPGEPAAAAQTGQPQEGEVGAGNGADLGKATEERLKPRREARLKPASETGATSDTPAKAGCKEGPAEAGREDTYSSDEAGCKEGPAEAGQSEPRVGVSRSGAAGAGQVPAGYVAADARLRRAERALEFRTHLVWLSATFALCLAASLCTPYHIHLYALPFRVMSHSALVRMIGEMGSPLAPHVVRHYLSFVVMATLLVAGLGAVRALRGRRPPAADVLILLFFGYEAVRHIRHLPLFAVATAPILGWTAGQLLASVGRSQRRRIAWLTMAAAVLLAVYWVAAREKGQSYWQRNQRLAAGVTYIPRNFPKAVCDFLLRNRFEGRMFNPVNVAGYMIWRLSPEHHKLFTDSRFDIFGDRFHWQEYTVRRGIEPADWEALNLESIRLRESDARYVRERVEGAGWQEILDRWDVNFIVAERAWNLVRNQKLRLSGRWECVFIWLKPPGHDPYDGYEIYVRRIDANRDLIQRARRDFERSQRLDRASRPIL